ncbi:hypothetical protein ACFQ6N_09265 [Kitasatospora sp. NPDC056446]|uniref:hypothetical protein n=1 Tax=Kitasatospora sp. NPDC056446 TaxID=3345819 RepID=UPI0036A9DBD3
MNVPDLIPIRHEPFGRTRTIGRRRGGCFLASATGVAGRPECYAVLHRFDEAGQHLDSRIESAAGIAEARRVLAGWLDALPGREYGDVAVAPFEVRVDGVLFGLVVEEDDEVEEDEEDYRFTAELYPDQLGFHAPWDGCYDT